MGIPCGTIRFFPREFKSLSKAVEALCVGSPVAKGIAIQSLGYRLTMSLSALNLGPSSLPMGLLNKEAGQESSHGVNLEYFTHR